MIVSLILNDVLTFVFANMVSYDYDNHHVLVYTNNYVYRSSASIEYDEYKDMTAELLVNKYLDLSGNFFDIYDEAYNY